MQSNASVLQYEIQDLEANQTLLDYEMEDMQSNASVLQYEIQDLEANQTLLDYEMEDMQHNMTIAQYEIDDLHTNQTILQDIIFNESKSINVIGCYSDEKETGTNGGTFPSNLWIIRDLNTFNTSNTSYFDINTSSNSIVIKTPGIYMIYANVPAYGVQNHMIRIYNTNKSITEEYGSSTHSVNECTHSFVEKEINITRWTELQIQHYCDKERINYGLGRSLGLDNINEKYTIVKIIKLQNNIVANRSYFVLYIYDKQSTGTNAGTFTAGIWQVRILNTIDTNLSSFASILSNQIILDPGIYIFSASVPAYGVQSHMARLYNITNSSIEVLGSSAFSNSETTISFIETFINISSTTTYEIQHYCDTTQIKWGFGKSAGIDEIDERYTSIKIIQML
jgi:hypothetical protein